MIEFIKRAVRFMQGKPYFAPSYFARSYFGGLGGMPNPPIKTVKKPDKDK